MKKQLRIESMYAFIQHDPVTNTEGVIAFFDRHAHVWMPMVGADLDRVDQLRTLAKDTAKVTGRPVRLVHFIGRQDKEVIDP